MVETIKKSWMTPSQCVGFSGCYQTEPLCHEIFVVTPKGDFKTMPAGCSVLDFAFSIHTILGTHCIGAKVNHNLVPISHVLKSGDQVEVLTSKEARVSPEWLNFITTAKAKAKIEAFLRKQRRESQKKGEKILADFLHNADTDINSLHIERLCDAHETTTREDLFAAIGEGKIVLDNKDLSIANGKTKKKKGSSWAEYLNIFRKKKEQPEAEDSTLYAGIIDKKKPLILSEETISRYLMCDCCQPIPGDDVLGYLAPDNRITIHKRPMRLRRPN